MYDIYNYTMKLRHGFLFSISKSPCHETFTVFSIFTIGFSIFTIGFSHINNMTRLINDKVEYKYHLLLFIMYVATNSKTSRLIFIKFKGVN